MSTSPSTTRPVTSSTRSDHSAPRWLWWVSIPAVALIVLTGVYVTGALITNNETVAKGLTGLWFGIAGVGALAVAWRWRSLALPVVGTFILVAGATGGYLLYSSMVDTVVDEQVVAIDERALGDTAGGNSEVAGGTFEAGAHPTSGTATVIDTADGTRVLTLTDFETDPGPDLRVYLVPEGSSGVEGGIDLGALKGNQGNQQYTVPEGAEPGSVVIWCRAFTVDFGTATLEAR